MGEDKTVYSPKYVGGTEGYGYGGMGGGAFVGGLLIGTLLSRRGGFGGFGGFGGGDCDGAANWSKLESIENQIQTQSITDNFVATNANINSLGRDTAIGFLGVQKDLCDLGARSDLQFANVNKNICESTTTVLNAIKDGEIQALRDKLASQTLDNEFNKRGLFEGSGPVITAHEPAHARDNDNLALMLANQQANSLNLAFNSGIQAGAFGQGQAAAQGLGQGALQK